MHWPNAFRWFAFAAIAILLCGLVFQQIEHARSLDAHAISTGERMAKEQLKTVYALEQKYSAAHPSVGFTCALSTLSTSDPISVWTTERDLTLLRSFLDGGIWGGYLFSIVDCKPEENGKVSEYKLVAVPLQPGVAGRKTFCIDQTGEIWRATDSSVAACLRRTAGSERIP